MVSCFYILEGIGLRGKLLIYEDNVYHYKKIMKFITKNFEASQKNITI